MVTDFDLADHGSIVLLTPRTPAASDWADEHFPPDAMKWGACSIVIEPRYVANIVAGIEADGLTVDH